MFKDLKIRIKLIIAFGLVFIFMTGLGILSIISLENAGRAARSMYENNLTIVRLALDTRYQSAELALNFMAFLDAASAQDTETAYAEITRTLAGIRSNLEDATARLETDKGRQTRTMLADTLQNLAPALETMITLKRAKNTREMLSFHAGSVRPLLTALQEQAAELARLALDRAKSHYEEMQTIRQNTVVLTVILNIAALVLGVLIALIIGENIVRPLHRLIANLKTVASGNLQNIELGERRKDEIGALIEAFKHFLTSFKTQIAEMSQMVLHLATSSNEISATSAQLSSSASETAASVAETATTAEEIRQVAETTRDLARNVTEATAHTSEISKEGLSSLGSMSDSITRIRDQMDKIAQSILNLSEQSQAIAEIIAAVDDIAEQSNLLAVNAAIEAAKAGEHGKGFAVVAQEVKSLAEQSKQSTRQVRKILSDIQKATSSAIMATEQGNKEVASGVQKSQEVNAAIRSLADSITGSTQLIHQITYANEQQFTGIDQINMAMDNIKIASTQNVEAARNLEQAVNSIKDLSARLKSLIEHYQL